MGKLRFHISVAPSKNYIHFIYISYVGSFHNGRALKKPLFIHKFTLKLWFRFEYVHIVVENAKGRVTKDAQLKKIMF